MIRSRLSVRVRFVRCCATLAGRYGAPVALADVQALANGIAAPGLSAKCAAMLVRMLRRKLARTAQEV